MRIPETHHWSFWYTHDYKKQEREGLIWCYNLSQRLLMHNIISPFVEDESLIFDYPYQSNYFNVSICHLVLNSVSWYLVILIHIHWRISVTFSPQYLFYNPSAKIMNRGDTYMYDTFILLSIRIIQLNEHLNLLKNCAGWCISRENAIHIHRLGLVWSTI